MKYIKNGIDMIITGILMYICYPFLPKNIWIISERLNQAQDNGIAFFEYMRRHQPQEETYYLLEKDSPYIKKVQTIGPVLLAGTLKHKLYFLKSKVVASTEKNMIEPWGSNVFYKYFAKLYPKKIKVFLQHGILDKDVSSVYGAAVSNFDLFVTSTDAEKEFVIEKFGYTPNQVINVGISRYDQLLEKSKTTPKENMILYMPTWRRYLIDLSNEDGNYKEETYKKILQTNYYKGIKDLIEDIDLKNTLVKENMQLIVILHHAMEIIAPSFNNLGSNIEIYTSEQVNIQDMICKAKVFITDYSSVHFDSAYVGNPNVYYQFDQEEFLKEHAGKSYFSYVLDGFGPVIESKEALLQQINELIDQKYEQATQYNDRREHFFENRDGQNSRRLYEYIVNSRS